MRQGRTPSGLAYLPTSYILTHHVVCLCCAVGVRVCVCVCVVGTGWGWKSYVRHAATQTPAATARSGFGRIAIDCLLASA